MTKEETWATLVALGVVEGKSAQTGWNLHQANLSEADLTLAYLAGVSLSEANLHEADFGRADLRRADLTDATLTASVLIKTDLTGANLSGACIDNANISGWVIRDVICSHIIEAKSGKRTRIGFEPLEFENKKYAPIRKTDEVITYLSGGNSMTDLQRLIERLRHLMSVANSRRAAMWTV